MIVDRVQKKGFSLRSLNKWLVIIAVVLSVVMIYSTYHLSRSSSHIADVSEQQISLRKAAQELMDASDYLTESVQCFVIYGDMEYLRNYFTEAFENTHREKAQKTMADDPSAREALYYLQNALDVSVNLMEREYYAMRLVIEANGYTDYPEILKSVELSPADAALTKEAKLHRAIDIVHNKKYSEEKEQIRNSVQACVEKLEKNVYEQDAKELTDLKNSLNFVRLIIILQTLAIFIMVFLTSRLGIHPILNAVQRIQKDSPIHEIGANEFRYLARTYNKMFKFYKTSLDKLNFKASHDGLTGAYNRVGYKLILSNLNLDTTCMILIDVDNFKTINDTYGHNIGDKTLVRVVQTLKNSFRSANDYICRLGGDEFVVLTTTPEANHLLETKITDINSELSADVELPSTSISVGVSLGNENSTIDTLFREADKALYETKRKGKRGCSFYVKD